MSASFVAAFGQFANLPRMPHRDWDELPYRLEIYAARHSAQAAGEWLAGYLHHEDPRPRLSTAHGFRRRTGSALMSAFASTDEDGHARLALAPIAGSFSSALVTMGMYHRNQNVDNLFMHAGFAYSQYLSRAMYREFKPELNSYVRHILRHDP